MSLLLKNVEEDKAALLRENKEEEHFEDQRLALEALAKRNVEVEVEMERLRADLVDLIHATEDATAEAALAKRMLGASKVKLEEMRKERAEVERKVRDLERHVGLLEVKETRRRAMELGSRRRPRSGPLRRTAGFLSSRRSWPHLVAGSVVAAAGIMIAYCSRSQFCYS